MALAFKLPSIAKDTTASTGDTGTIVVDEEALDGFNLIADVLADGDETVIARDNDDGVTGATEREVISVTWDETNKRFTVLGVVESTNGGNRINWPSGTTNLFVVIPGGNSVVRNNAGNALDGEGRSLSFEPSIDQGTKSSGTFTPEPSSGAIQTITNGGAFTLAPPTEQGVFMLTISNNASAGAITTSGFDEVLGDSLDTTDGNDFECIIVNDGNSKSLQIRAKTGNT